MPATTENDPDGPIARERQCLMCGEGFVSEGAHNRICGKCKSSRTWRAGSPVTVFSGLKAAS